MEENPASASLLRYEELFNLLPDIFSLWQKIRSLIFRVYCELRILEFVFNCTSISLCYFRKVFKEQIFK